MLNWTEETIGTGDDVPKWSHGKSNLVLDFHGDPLTAKLVVFSDGNHHMALKETLQLFFDKKPQVGQIFYATTPPGPVLNLLKKGKLQIGNFMLSVKPHVFISPPQVLDKLVNHGYITERKPFVKNRGNVLLVKKGNPKHISGIADLVRPEVRVFLSNPETETVSYRGYFDTLKGIAKRDSVELPFLSDENPGNKIIYGDCIHHREAPQVIEDGIADVAVVYYHLALRYIRIFPSLFEIVPLGGTASDPKPFAENIISSTHAGIIGDGGEYGTSFLDFLFTKPVGDIYASHGLLPYPI